MNQKCSALIGAAVCSLFTLVNSVQAQGTAFTYQGQLLDNGSPASGSNNLTFTLFDAATGGVPIAGPLTNNGVGVTNGLFAVTLDFGQSVWNGAPNWLEIAVEPVGSNSFTTLSPRQPMTPFPYAIFANTASNLAGTISAAQLIGTVPLDVLTNFEGPYYNTVGGGSDNNALYYYATVGGGYKNTANGQDATVGGGEYNVAIGGATVGGGQGNMATNNYATVGGGQGNRASGNGATVAGGYANYATNDFATIGGGLSKHRRRHPGHGGRRRLEHRHQRVCDGGRRQCEQRQRTICDGGRWRGQQRPRRKLNNRRGRFKRSDQ